MKKINFIELLVFILICEFAGFIGSIFTFPAIPTWYVFLKKSSLNPPNFIFGPVWTILFFLMGVSLYFVWRHNGKNKLVKNALMIFTVQMLFNVFWSLLFFGFKNPLFAFVEILVLWFFIFLTIIYFMKIDRLAGLLLIPYILWVSFASYLNLMVYLLNK